MGRKPVRSDEEKLQVVLGVLRGEMTQVEAARRLEMFQTTIAKWHQQFLDGAHEALARGNEPIATLGLRQRRARTRRRVPRHLNLRRRSEQAQPQLDPRVGGLLQKRLQK